MTSKKSAMKTTIKLLIGLLILVTGILSFTNYNLAKQYAAIDTEDNYHEYEQFHDLIFHSIEINGGNEVQVVVEKGDKNSLYIHNHFSDNIEYSNQNGNLVINFHDNLTDKDFDPREHDHYRNTPIVYISYTNLTSVLGNNGNIVVKTEMDKALNLKCSGSSTLLVNISALNGGILNVEGSDNSYIHITDLAEKGSLPIAHINLKDRGYLKMKSLQADSIALQMDPESEINCGSSVVAKLK